MITHLSPESWTFKYYPSYDDNSEDYKLSDYVITIEHEGNIVLLHTITWSIYTLTKEEFDNILTNQLLIKYKVVLPSSIDELKVATDVYLSRVSPSSYPSYTNINHFTVLTTTSCNARCFYCYENCIGKNLTMTKEIADDVIKFIIKHGSAANRPIDLQWFGGEPLLNKKIIDYITEKIYESGLQFESSIITNAYLLDEETVAKLDYWKIEYIQITFDGLYEEYNKVKNYVYKDVDAYSVVIKNIKNLLEKSNVSRIAIKLNATNDNIFRIKDQLNTLKEEFKDYLDSNRLIFTIATLYDYIKDPDSVVEGYWEEFRTFEKIAYVPVPNTIDKFLLEDTYNRHPINFQCQAYDGNTFIIKPDGKLVRCGLIRDEDIYGDIYDGVTNFKVLDEWKNFNGPEIDFCKNNKCVLHPICPRFYKCNSCGICSTQSHMDRALKLAKEKLVRSINYINDKS